MTSNAPFDIGRLIECTPGVYGGRPRLARSGLPIIQLVADYQAGMRLEEFYDAYPGISEAEIHAGIAYYLVNKATLDAELIERDAAGAAALATHRATTA